MILKRVAHVFRAGGLGGLLRAIARRMRNPHAKSFPVVAALVRDRTGLEIGGPSPLFARGGMLPVYPLVARVDNCNFASSTIWEGEIKAGDTFVFHPGKAPGRQVIAEGADLGGLADASYQFVLSSHMLEHTSNPLRALGAWQRVLMPGGTLLLILPHRDGTFDHRRPVTLLDHLRDDRDGRMGEDDLTHLPEVLALHDHARDPGSNPATFADRMQRNAEFRSLHHHVFDCRLAVAVAREAGFAVQSIEALEPYHIVLVAQKPLPEAAPGLSDAQVTAALANSPFASDR